MKRIAVITSTRAEFGLLMPVIKELKKWQNDKFCMEVVATGTHLSKDFGYTIEEIFKEGIAVDVTINIPVDTRNAVDISHNQSIAIEKFTELFVKKTYCGIVILGDRYEMLAIAIAAGNTHTPIFHLCGGDTTEGSIDEWIRHSITKMSYLHFPSNVISYRRVLQLGETPDRIFNYGSTSIDNIVNNANMTKLDVLKSVGLDDCRYAVCTYHPVTMEGEDMAGLIGEFLRVIRDRRDINFIVTKSNADQGGAEINRILDEANETIENLYVYSSLGVVRYLSLMKYSEFVLGNSSSGIIETPAFKIPTINIGDRQRGRLQSKSIINCNEDYESIMQAIEQALCDDFRKKCANVRSPYGDGHAGEQIAKKIYEVVMSECIDLKKKFHDLY